MAIEKLDINQYFYEYMLQNKLTFLICALLLFTYPLQKVVLPKYYGKVISNLQDGSNKKFIESAKMLLIIYASIQFLHSIYQKVQGTLIPKFSEFSMKKIFSSLLKNDNEDFENMKVGEILAKISKLPSLIYRYLDILKSVVFSQLIVFATCVFHYYQVSFQTFLSFILVVFGVLLLQFITYKTTMGVETKREQEQDKIYQHLQDVLNNLISVIVCKNEEYEKDKLTQIFGSFTKTFNKVLNINFIMRVIFSFFNIFSFCLLNYILYKEYSNKNITKEHFISSFIITYSVLQLFNDGAHSVRMLVDMTSQITDMEQFFNSQIFQKKHDSNEDDRFVNGDIIFKNVNHTYNKDGSEHVALKNVNLKIKQNENIALTGHIGSGKSTLIKALLKLTVPTSGTVTIGGVDINNISKKELYSHVFYIPQKPKLMNRTLYENIIYGLEEPENKKDVLFKIDNIMTFMKLDDITKQTFTEKMNESVGLEGSKLSGGQRQIVWIIRALLRNPSIIIMDEPTSSLDKSNKQKIYNIIEEIGIQKTIIVISHDDISLGFKKVYMKDGKVSQLSI
jgi:ABC-type multidrug transport system fused ATPase/permease subunit